MKRSLIALLVLGASLLLVVGRSVERPDAPHPAPRPQVTRPPANPPPPQEALGDPRLEAQVRAVMDAMDRTGRPPEGIAQGGRRGGRRGVFENAERRLPVQAPGYYRETDVWPRGSGGRGGERLVFGRQGEVYYTGDHYRTFARVR
jgi:guanyl-specific ribonuclease Sa